MRDLINTVSRELATNHRDAGQIIAAILRRRPHELYMMDDVGADDRMIVLRYLGFMKRGMPVEYLTGTTQFREHSLRIQNGVFIPRAETEYLVELVQKMVRRHPKRILEIGTGCGAISIALASVYTEARVVSTDISDRAIDNALLNVRDHGLEQRIALIKCDMYGGIGGEFDLIVSNPPYIPRPRIKYLTRSVRQYEPLLALDGGTSGVEFTQRLIVEGQDHLASDGMMFLEIDEESVEILAGFMDNENIGPFSFIKDLYGRDRYLVVGVFDEES